MCRIRLTILSFLLLAAAASGTVGSSDFNSAPTSEGWNVVQQYCDPVTWVEGGWYYQGLDLEGCPPPDGDQDVYTRSIDHFNEASGFFIEFRVETDGNRSEIPGGAPAALAAFNSFGILYHVTVATDQLKLLRDVDLPILFIDVQPGTAHTIRLELQNDTYPTYVWYIDGQRIDEGKAEGDFPVRDATITWIGAAWHLPCENRWDYIRFGDIPTDASGNFVSDEHLDLFDFFFFHECLTNRRPGINGGPGNDAGPGCRFADFDSDSDVDLLDYAEFQVNFTGNN